MPFCRRLRDPGALSESTHRRGVRAIRVTVRARSARPHVGLGVGALDLKFARPIPSGSIGSSTRRSILPMPSARRSAAAARRLESHRPARARSRARRGGGCGAVPASLAAVETLFINPPGSLGELNKLWPSSKYFMLYIFPRAATRRRRSIPPRSRQRRSCPLARQHKPDRMPPRDRKRDRPLRIPVAVLRGRAFFVPKVGVQSRMVGRDRRVRRHKRVG